MTTLNDESTDLLASIQNDQIIEEFSKLKSYDGLTLHLHSWRGPVEPDKVMVVVHGLGGHGAYYANAIVPYLVPARTIIYAVDLRGHGLSEGIRGDIDTFERFQHDVTAAVRQVRKLHPDLPLFMLGESMGTPIAINYVVNAPQDARPDFLALIACVIAPTVKPRPDEIVRTLYYLARDRRRVAIPITGREEQGIRDVDFIQVLKTDVLFNRKVSIRFLSNLTMHTRRAAGSPGKLTLPVFMAQGGKDITVNHRRTRNFFYKIASTDKELHYFPEGFHAMLNDPDSPALRQLLLDWMDRQLTAYSQARAV